MKPLIIGQQLTLFTISEWMAHTQAHQLKVKTVLPEPVPLQSYVNGPLVAYRYGTMTLAGKRKELGLVVKINDLLFDGWDVPFVPDSEVKHRPGPFSTVTRAFSGNACYNLAGSPEAIKDWIEHKCLNPVSDDTKAKIIVLPVDDEGYLIYDSLELSDHGTLLYPEIQTSHAVVNRMKSKTAPC